MKYPGLTYYRSQKHRSFNPVLALFIGIGIGLIIMMLTGFKAVAEESPRIIYDYRIKQNVVVIADKPSEVSNSEEPSNPYQALKISDEEFNELRWVLALEARGEGLKGEIACCEAIFNRCLSQKNNWGGSVHGVLSKKGQFSTYKYIGSKKAWVTPGELEDDAISECLRQGPKILPSMSYVYFDSRGGVNGKHKIRIGGHTFGEE